MQPQSYVISFVFLSFCYFSAKFTLKICFNQIFCIPLQAILNSYDCMYKGNRFIASVIFSVLYISFVSAQILTKDNHMPCVTDSLYAYKITYVAPLDTGLNCLWDFSNLSIDDTKNVRVDYFPLSETDDSTRVGLHHEHTNYYYHVIGDTLWLTGYETSRASMTYVLQMPQLCFPFAYGDTLCGNFLGSGQFYRRNSLNTEGVIYVKADATGRLITPYDTIDNVLRINSKMKYHEDRHPHNYVQEEKYTWFSSYCRYPLIESVLVQIIKNSDTLSFASTYFYPQEQNEELRKRDIKKDLNIPQEDSLITNIQFTPNPVYDNVQIKYSLAKSAKVYISLHYDGGLTTYQTPYRQEDEGDHSISLNMSGMPTGSYVIYIHADDLVASGSLIKL